MLLNWGNSQRRVFHRVDTSNKIRVIIYENIHVFVSRFAFEDIEALVKRLLFSFFFSNMNRSYTPTPRHLIAPLLTCHCLSCERNDSFLVNSMPVVVRNAISSVQFSPVFSCTHTVPIFILVAQSILISRLISNEFLNTNGILYQ